MLNVVKNFVYSIKKKIFRYEITLNIFLYSFIVYLVLTFFPDVIHLMYNREFNGIIKKVYSIVKLLCETLVTGSLFVLIHESLNEASKLKNKIKNALSTYEQMKHNILDRMILTSNNYLMPPNLDDLIKNIYLNPKKAQNFFTQDRFINITKKLDTDSLRTILREIESCLNELSALNDEFISNGNYALHSTVKFIKELKAQIDQWIESEERWLDWCEQATPKTCNRLYCLFCQESDNKDPIHENLSKIM